ncbi:MAG: hypothetical protein A2942_01785 [Candidatus Lloydbacteria bacterium RIFCSPLOWO2_01_FULL_50_20]|uniref:Uncharacterized protein n=1 Tax=Candidatus Lloydbacteria bacterium RIFCSPLOWO2_01_FULL_50_20 TaxID=1798665 RepID=A0A1G2DGJ5_9BACT|nr:MAG: hypothetical protein A3C13_01155 [Candidatus Lloydbacteria bacterium RIFCSPHIGHO2_02_FULL_50_11]OGZ11990.1 MAG: hypothetical protein A2942_01785 [Candidatus Lloydbacteria bacterium RIFCSPLOWO2_01_FULL_50_20]
MNKIWLSAALASTLLLVACGDGKNVELERLTEMNKTIADLDREVLGEWLPCVTNTSTMCRDVATIIGHKALVQAGRCDGGNSVFVQFEIKRDGSQSDELFIIWHQVGAYGQMLADHNRYVAAIYGEQRAVGYLIGHDGFLTNEEYREIASRVAPNAFAHLAYHGQGDCVKLK